MRITKRELLLVVVVCLLVSGASASAHHSFAATYHEDKTVKIEGKIAQFLFRNPHSFVHIQAPDESGAMQRWAVEWGGTGQLAGQGVTAETLKAGQNVIVTGNPGRNPADHRIRMVTLRRTSDGFGWGTRPGEVVD